MSQEPAPYEITTADTYRARRAAVFAEIAAERNRQEILKAAALFRFLEAHGEAAAAHGKELRKELIQVAAVVVAWVERLDAEAEPSQRERST